MDLGWKKDYTVKYLQKPYINVSIAGSINSFCITPLTDGGFLFLGRVSSEEVDTASDDGDARCDETDDDEHPLEVEVVQGGLSPVL